MAYKHQDQRILAGSLNLAAPPDMVPDTDSIALHNWRVDSLGCLRSRRTFYEVAALGVPGANIHTLFRAADTRYFVINETLYCKIGAGGALTPVAALLDGTPMHLCSFQGHVWAMNRSVRVRDRLPGSDAHAWTPQAPALAPTYIESGAGSLVDGQVYEYWVTFVTADGWETNPSPVLTTAAITAGQGQVTVTRPSMAGGETYATHWNLYRKGNTVQVPYRVNRDPVAYATGTYVDTGAGYNSDSDILIFGIQLEFDHGAAPACSGAVGPYYQRIVAFSSAAHPNRIYFTPTNRPYMFRGVDEADGDWLDVGEHGDEIVAVRNHGDHLRIYLKRSVWVHRGDMGVGSLHQLSSGIGLIGPKAIDSESGIDYWQGQEGIYAGDSDQAKKISAKVEPLFLDGVSYGGGASPTAGLDPDETKRARACLAVKNGRLYFSYLPVGAAAHNALLVCDLSTLEWASADTGIPGVGGYSALYYEGQYSELLGAVGSSIYALEQKAPTESIALKWISGYRDQGRRDRKKVYGNVAIEHSVARGTADQALTVKLKKDSGDGADEALGSIHVATAAAGAERMFVQFPVGVDGKGVRGRNGAVLIEGNSNYEACIYSVNLSYRVLPREARTFDSGPLDFGDPRVKALDFALLDLENEGVVTYEFLTELPSGTLAQRKTGTFPIGGQRPVTITMEPEIEGRLVWVRMTSPAPFLLYSLKLRYRPIGVYLSGTAGEIWDTQVVAVAI